MNAPQPARFLAPSYAEEAAAATEAIEQRFAREHAQHVAMTAMLAGVPDLIVDRTHSKETLADMLSMHTTNYRVDIGGRNPVDLLCVMLAAGLCSDDEAVYKACLAFAKRVQADYVLCREEVTA